MAPREWKRVKMGLPADYTILKVREDVVEDPRDGQHHPRVVIDCPDWAVIIPVTLDERLVLIRQFRNGIWANSLEVPGGIVDPGEDPRIAAIRELEEETGFVPGRVIPLGAIHPNVALQTNRCHIFLALGCDATGEKSFDEGEDIELLLTPRNEVWKLLREGKITHALVVAAFMLERLFWDKETSYKED